MSFDRRKQRSARRFMKKLHDGSAKQEAENGTSVPVLGTSHVEALAALRLKEIPPAPPGAGDMGERDRVDPVAYQRKKNADKRSRRARRTA